MPSLKTARKLTICTLASLALAPQIGLASDKSETMAACKAAYDLLNDGDIKGALEESKWCTEGLSQLSQSRSEDILAKDIAGWQRGDMTHNKAMGMTVTETQYKKGAEIIGLTITQGAGAMGGALAQLGMMGGGNRVRLGSHSGMLIPGEGLMISLPGGKMINLTGVPASDASLKALARKLPLDKLAAN